MTAEIAVINRNGVALAADSAGTITGPGGSKVYNSATKLMMLSDAQPVGIMTFGAGGFLGIEWDLVFHEFRREHGHVSYPHLIDYANAFIDFIAANERLFPEADKKKHLQHRVWRSMKSTCDELSRVCEIVTGSGATDEQCAAEVERIVSLHLKSTARDRLLSRGRVAMSELAPQMKVLVAALVEEFDDRYSATSLPGVTVETLRQLGIYAVTDRVGEEAGFVVAGYGSDDIFPSVYAFDPVSILDHTVLFYERENKSHEVNRWNSSGNVLAFAQHEVVDAFLDGIDHGFFLEGSDELEPPEGGIEEPEAIDLQGLAASAMSSMVECVEDESLGLSKAQKKSVEAALVLAGTNAMNQLQVRTVRSVQSYRKPMQDAVNFLTKDDLARLAESLVNLTSLKRRFTMSSETVGGPIDVAVITRADGFVWINRKHYFETALNPHFMSRKSECVALEEKPSPSPTVKPDDQPVAQPKKRGRPKKTQ